MSNPDLIPRITEPISAHELLTKVRKLILEEPRRYDQTAWITRGTTDAFPACGTVACVAGWITTLRASPEIASYLSSHTDPNNHEDYLISAVTKRALGLTKRQASELFDGRAIARISNARPGTQAYAELGDRHIRKFQRKYAKQLKAKRVQPMRFV